MSAESVPSESSEGDFVPRHSPCFWWFAGNLWHFLGFGDHPNLCLHPHMVFSVHARVSKFLLLVRTLVIFD